MSVRRRLVVDIGRGVGATVLVAGSARSGTTWLADRLAAASRARVIFEPFVVDAFGRPACLTRWRWREAATRRSISRYLPPGAAGDPWTAAVARILGGRVPRPWKESSAPGLYRRRVVKAVRGNLLLGHVAARWPRLPIVWLVRDPVAVVESQVRQARRGWDFDWDPACALHQPLLMQDWLAPFESAIRSAGDLVDRLALRWCIENYVPLRQDVEARGVLRLDYTDLCRSEGPWQRLSAHLERSAMPVRGGVGPGGRGVGPDGNLAAEPGRRPSGTLDADSIRRVRRRIESFGLGDLARAGESP